MEACWARGHWATDHRYASVPALHGRPLPTSPLLRLGMLVVGEFQLGGLKGSADASIRGDVASGLRCAIKHSH